MNELGVDIFLPNCEIGVQQLIHCHASSFIIYELFLDHSSIYVPYSRMDLVPARWWGENITARDFARDKRESFRVKSPSLHVLNRGEWRRPDQRACPLQCA
jgi:hypothetical protein